VIVMMNQYQCESYETMMSQCESVQVIENQYKFILNKYESVIV